MLSEYRLINSTSTYIDAMDKPKIDTNCILQKMPGKGGWTFVAIPEIQLDKKQWFGWIKVDGTIDGYEITNYHLMPLGDGALFLPVNAKIRKIIGKGEGDVVHVVLFSQSLPPVDENDFMTCLRDEPLALFNFNNLPLSEQEKITQWIYSVKNDDLRVERIAQSIDRLIAL